MSPISISDTSANGVQWQCELSTFSNQLTFSFLQVSSIFPRSSATWVCRVKCRVHISSSPFTLWTNNAFHISKNAESERHLALDAPLPCHWALNKPDKRRWAGERWTMSNQVEAVQRAWQRIKMYSMTRDDCWNVLNEHMLLEYNVIQWPPTKDYQDKAYNVHNYTWKHVFRMNDDYIRYSHEYPAIVVNIKPPHARSDEWLMSRWEVIITE